MEKLTIRQKSILVALVPSILMCLILAIYYLFSHTRYIKDSLTGQGKRITRDIGFMSREVLSGDDIASARVALTQVMKANDIVRLEIFDPQGRVLLRLWHPNLNPSSEMTFSSFVHPKDVLNEGRSINSINYQVGSKIRHTQPTEKRPTAILGRVAVTLSVDIIGIEQQRIIVSGIVVAGITLIVGILCGLIFSHSLTGPLLSILEKVSNIRLRNDSFKHSVSNLDMPKNEIECLGVFIGLMSTAIDQRIAELTDARREADKLNQAKSEFISLISEELRLPLDAMREMMIILKDTRINPVQRNCIHAILEASQSMSDLLHNINEFSIADKQLNSSFQLLDVVSVVEDVIRVCRADIGSKEVEIIGDITSRETKLRHYFLVCDPYLFRYLLHLLVSESIKTTNKGVVSVKVDLAEAIPGRCSLDILVKDTGLGLPKETTQQILDLWHLKQALPVGKVVQGINNDVVTIQQLVRRMKGTAEISSELNNGTYYRVSLEFDCLSPEATRDLICRKEPEIQASKVMLVGSGQEQKEVLVALMAHLGVDLDVVDSVQQAFEWYQISDYKVIFIDCSSPQIAGYSLAQQIREHEEITFAQSRIPLIGITNQVSSIIPKEETCDEFYNAGIDDVIFAPFDQIELYRMVSSHLAVSQQLSEMTGDNVLVR